MKAPLFSKEAIMFIDGFLKKSHVVFEYGSGYSTLYIASLCHKIISVEHNDVWFKKINQEIADNGYSNIDLFFLPPDKKVSTDFYSDRVGKSFKNYVLKILKYPCDYFDLVIVDGRARPSCVKHSISRIKPGGIILIDDAGRDHYKPCFDLLTGFDLVVSANDNLRNTRIYRKSSYENSL